MTKTITMTMLLKVCVERRVLDGVKVCLEGGEGEEGRLGEGRRSHDLQAVGLGRGGRGGPGKGERKGGDEEEGRRDMKKKVGGEMKSEVRVRGESNGGRE